MYFYVVHFTEEKVLKLNVFLRCVDNLLRTLYRLKDTVFTEAIPLQTTIFGLMEFLLTNIGTYTLKLFKVKVAG